MGLDYIVRRCLPFALAAALSTIPGHYAERPQTTIVQRKVSFDEALEKGSFRQQYIDEVARDLRFCHARFIYDPERERLLEFLKRIGRQHVSIEGNEPLLKINPWSEQDSREVLATTGAMYTPLDRRAYELQQSVYVFITGRSFSECAKRSKDQRKRQILFESGLVHEADHAETVAHGIRLKGLSVSKRTLYLLDAHNLFGPLSEMSAYGNQLVHQVKKQGTVWSLDADNYKKNAWQIRDTDSNLPEIQQVLDRVLSTHNSHPVLGPILRNVPQERITDD